MDLLKVPDRIKGHACYLYSKESHYLEQKEIQFGIDQNYRNEDSKLRVMEEIPNIVIAGNEECLI